MCRTNVDRVEFAAIFVVELTGHEGTDIAAPCGVLIITEDISHEYVPKIGNLPEVHVRVVRQWRRETETRKRGYHNVKGIGGIAAECAWVRKRIDDFGPMSKRPRPAVGQNQRNRVRVNTGFAHKVYRNSVNVYFIVFIDVDRCLGFAPVKFVDPVVNESLKVFPAN